MKIAFYTLGDHGLFSYIVSFSRNAPIFNPQVPRLSWLERWLLTKSGNIKLSGQVCCGGSDPIGVSLASCSCQTSTGNKGIGVTVNVKVAIDGQNFSQIAAMNDFFKAPTEKYFLGRRLTDIHALKLSLNLTKALRLAAMLSNKNLTHASYEGALGTTSAALFAAASGAHHEAPSIGFS